MNKWEKIWYDLMIMDDKKQGRERWYQFLREEGLIHLTKRGSNREFFDEIWRETRREKEELMEAARSFDNSYDPDWRPAR